MTPEEKKTRKEAIKILGVMKLYIEYIQHKESLRRKKLKLKYNYAKM